MHEQILTKISTAPLSLTVQNESHVCAVNDVAVPPDSRLKAAWEHEYRKPSGLWCIPFNLTPIEIYLSESELTARRTAVLL